MKVYIYCTKAKPYLLKESLIINNKPRFFTSNSNKDKINDDDYIYNGKVVASFDLNKVIKLDNNYYNWNIENLQVFDEPMDLGYFTETKKSLFTGWFERVKRPPKSWFRVFNRKSETCILISINPQQVEKILNGEQTIIIRKTAPKELNKYEKTN